MKLKLNVVAVIFSLLFFSTNIFSQTTYYVATSGSDSNPGTTLLPFQTITYAYSLVSAGDIIIVKPGVYTDFTPWAGIAMNKNGTAVAPITLKSQFKWQATLDGGNLSNHTAAVTIYGSYNIVEGFEMINGFEGGVYVAGSAQSNQILNNNIHDNGTIGNLTGSNGQFGVLSEEFTAGTTYYGNYIHHNGRSSINSNLDHGMYLTGDNETIVNNIVSFNCSYGIHIAGYDTVSNMRVYNNVFSQNGRSGAIMWQDMDGIYFRNNIFYNNAELGLLCLGAHGGNVVIDNNLFYGNPQGDMNMVWSGSNVAYTSNANISGYDPAFVNGTSDYHLLPGSPAIDQGITLSPYVIDDFEGTPRPQGAWYDLGAYEYFTGTSSVSSVTKNETEISLFPNPATTFIYLKSESVIGAFAIYNSLGEIILKDNCAISSQQINITSFPKGIYILKSAGKSQRFVKE